MKRNRRNNVKKERIIMIASSAFVLSALTMTGIYMKSNNEAEQDDGYMLDFTALEEDVQNKAQEIAQNDQVESHAENGGTDFSDDLNQQLGSLDDDLDYLPMEVGSGLVTIPGLTDGISEAPAVDGNTPIEEETNLPAGDTPEIAEAIPGDASEDTLSEEGEQSTETSDSASGETEEQAQESSDSDSIVAETMHFTESEGLLRPVSGEVLIPFSMDSSVYFSTLDQFKYNPAMMIAAEQGTGVSACAEGVVIDIFQDEEIGHAITMDLGDGYQITYGQLYDINVTLNSHVEPGETIASVATPTKYFSVEGSNLYLKLTEDGKPVDPESLFRE